MDSEIALNRTLGNFAFTFEPPLDPRTDNLDLIDAVVLQRHINSLGGSRNNDIFFTNPFVVNERERDEVRVGSQLFYFIDHPTEADLQTHDHPDTRRAMGRYVSDLTQRHVTVDYLYELPTGTV